MPQSILIQVGQCGNQIGNRFWDLALQEHARYNRRGWFDESMATFFRNVDRCGHDLPVKEDLNSSSGGSWDPIQSLKARGILVDMEEGVIQSQARGPFSELFDPNQRITAQSGCGNNWAVGNLHYGPEYRDRLLEAVRKQVEHCDALQSFFLCHSMGGGTGSGLGTYLLRLLDEEFPDVYRFSNVVFPSADDDVITSPYNSVLALAQLTEHADCVLPIENLSLMDMTNRIASMSSTKKIRAGSGIDYAITEKNKKEKAFDTMNAIVANVMLNMTSSMRFEGSLNVDINEISMNLVPFPRLKYLVSSLTPLYTLADVKMPERKLDQMFTDAFHRDCQLLKADPKNSTYLACALMLRGDVQLSDIRRNIEKAKKQLRFVPWNTEGWKTGLCAVPPVGQPYSLLCLANNSCITSTFGELGARFQKLFRRKAHVHHYIQEGMDCDMMEASWESLRALTSAYQQLDNAPPPT